MENSDGAGGAADVCEVDVPIFIELKNSSYGSGDLGAYCTMPLNADQFLGSYKGKTKKSMAQCADPEYVWTVSKAAHWTQLYDASVTLVFFQTQDPQLQTDASVLHRCHGRPGQQLASIHSFNLRRLQIQRHLHATEPAN